jgi:predicted lipoprotein with Yx(FWY)xxD motif
MRQVAKLLLPTLSAAVLLAACGSSSSSSTSNSAASSGLAATPAGTSVVTSAIKTASNSKLGRTVLVDSQGLTLYHLTGEQNGKWICTSAACVQAWHPVITSSDTAPKGSVGSLATVARPDGTMQVTYKGMPLYTFVKDTSPGQATGQGIKDVGTWTAVTTNAASTKPAAPAPASTTPAPASSSGGGSYSY